jgi:hypothetical protein
MFDKGLKEKVCKAFLWSEDTIDNFLSKIYICKLYGALEPRNYLGTAYFVLYMLPIYLHYILMKLEQFNVIICIIIDHFVVLTPPPPSFLQLDLGPFFTFVRP